jgi:hypothetical protein
MILEAIVTTISEDASVHIAAMGPCFEPGSSKFELRPFETAITFRNLVRARCGVMHVTDDVLLFARAVTGELASNPPEMKPAEKISGQVLVDCCRHYEFRVSNVVRIGTRASVPCEVLSTGWHRDFYGFNRAKHAVIEAAIGATRIGFLPEGEVRSLFDRCSSIVIKTGGEREKLAFRILDEFVAKSTSVGRFRSHEGPLPTLQRETHDA